MSFFKKLAGDFDRLVGSDDKEKPRQDGGHSQSSHNRDYPQQYPQAQQYSGHSPQPYQGYSAPPPQHQPPPQQHQSSSAPAYQLPAGKPPIPAGWIPQWDSHYQRWYYVEEASGRSQWEAPGFDQGHGSDTRGHGGYGGGGHGGGHGGYSGYSGGGGHHDSGHGYSGEHHKEKKSGSSGMLMGAAGGLAVGAVGGAVVASALHDSDSDSEHHSGGRYGGAPAYGGAPVYGGGGGGYYEQPAPAPALAYDSDHSSLNEARGELREAEEAAADSSASSSDEEELAEAREEYAEEYEEAHEDEYGSD